MELRRTMTTPAAIEARMERIPLLRWHWTVLGIVGIAQAVEAIDSLAVAFALPVLIKLWTLTPVEAGILVSAMYSGQMVGGAGFGWLSERLGRLNLLRWATAALVILGLVAASAWNYSSFLVFRFLQGIAFGGELVLASAYIAEVSATSFRGRLVFALNVVFSAGVILAAVIATYVVPNFGWRWIFIIAAVGSLPFFLFARRLPESPRWLACRGRLGEADAIVTALEARATATGVTLSEAVPASVVADAPASLARWSDLFAPDVRWRTLLLWTMAMTVGTIGVTMISWLPRFFQLAYDMPLTATLAMSAISFSAPLLGSLFGAVVVDRLKRTRALVVGYVALSVALLAMWHFMGAAPIPVAVALAFVTILFQVFLLFMLYLVMVEYYPTRLRGMGSGAGRFWLSISAIVGPIGAGAVSSRWGVEGALLSLFGLAVVGLVAILGLGRLHERPSPNI